MANRSEQRPQAGAAAGQRGGAGETSASVAETNRMRAELGLAPLAVYTKEDAARDQAAAAAAAEEARKAAETAQWRDELAKRKNKRELAKSVEGESLGEMLKKETAGQAQSWVERSRTVTKVTAEKLKAQERARQLAEQEQTVQYDANDLSGMRVQHEFSEFDEGQNMVLTLKDTYILKDGRAEELNADEDVLENIGLVEKEKRDKLTESKVKKPRYNPTDEEGSLLAKYDDEKIKFGIRLDARADKGVDEGLEKEKRAEAIRAKLGDLVDDEKSGKRVAYDLTSQAKVSSDYKEVKFKKLRKVAKDKKSASRKQTLDELFPEPDPAGSASATAAVAGAAPGSVPAARSEDHASRSAPRAPSAAEEEERRRQALRDQGYLKALRKAEQDNKKLVEVASTAFEEEDDLELQSSLERARRLQAEQKKAKQGESAVTAMANQLRARSKAEDEAAKQAAAAAAAAAERDGDADGDARMPGLDAMAMGRSEDGGLVFTSTTEFVRGLDSMKEAMRASAAAAAVKKEKEHKGGDEVKVKKEPRSGKDAKDEDEMDLGSDDEGGREPPAKRAKTELNVNEDAEDDSDAEDPAAAAAAAVKREDGEGGEVDDDDDGDILHDEPAMNVGIAAALQLAKRRGFTAQKSDHYGRATDKDLAMGEDPAPNIKLDRVDAQGRPLKIKEAFRLMSHKFHGRGPGAMKQEKKMKKLEEEERKRKAVFADPSQGSEQLKRLKQRQQDTGQAHVVLDQRRDAAALAALVAKVPDLSKDQGSKKGKGGGGKGKPAGGVKRKREQ